MASSLFSFDSRWELRLARTSPDSVSAPVDLSAGVSSVVARYAGAWSDGALWVVDEIERPVPAEKGQPRSVLRVRKLAPDQLPERARERAVAGPKVATILVRRRESSCGPVGIRDEVTLLLTVDTVSI